MPCDQQRITTVDMQKVNPDLFTAALKDLGYYVATYPKYGMMNFYRGEGQINSFHFKTGKLEITTKEGEDTSLIIDEIKQAYSRTVIQTVAKRAGWKITAKDKTHLVVRR